MKLFPCIWTDDPGDGGFTLIEVIVVVAILSILTGIMVPMAHQVWERNEITRTRDKIVQLKKAIVGDQGQIQGGIRMHYGFVGDNGELPGAFSDLVTDAGTFVNWDGPYMLGAFDPSEYLIDAWGNSLFYNVHSPPLAVAGLTIVATLRSSGPDGTLGTGDDIDEDSDPDLQILSSEVQPAAMIQGNVEYVFAAAVTVTPAYSFDLYGVYATPAGTATISTGCEALAIGTVEAGIAKSVRQSFSLNLVNDLPIGRVDVGSRLYSNGTCGGAAVSQSSEVAVFVSDGLSAISLNIPTLHYVIP